MSEAAPTGIGMVDAIERAAFVALLVVAGARARRWALIVGSGLVAIASTGMAQLAGIGALALVVVLVFTRRRDRVVGALIGGLVALASLHLEVGGFLGLETLIGLAATVPVLVSAYQYASSRVKRRVRLGAALGGGVAALLVAVAAVAAVVSIGPLEDAVDATRDGVDAARGGEGTTAAESFAGAEDDFRRAESRVGAWWASGGRVLPLVGPNLGAAQDAVRLGSALTSSARTITADVDFDRVQSSQGGVDLQVLAGFEAPVREAARTLDTASEVLGSLDSPWILGPLDVRLDELAGEVEDLRSQSEAAELGVTHGPAILGADAPRRYLFLLGNPAELRDLGGHIGNWAEVVVDDGRLELVEVGGPLDLSIPAAETPEWLDTEFPAGLQPVQPALFPQNWGSDPDLPTVAQLASRLFEQSTGRAIDGVLYADVEMFAGLLELTGPVPVGGLADPLELSSENAVKFLTLDQFVLFADESSGSDALEAVIRQVFDQLTTMPLPGPKALGELFAPLVHSGSFQFATLHEEDVPLLERFGLRGDVPAPEGGDLLAVVQRNAGPSKIDTFLSRRTEVNVEWNPSTGEVASVVTVELHNDAPAEGLNRVVVGNAAGAPWGTNVTDLAVITPFALRSVLVEGTAAASHPVEDGGHWRHTVRVAIPPGGTRTVNFHLRGKVRPGRDYEMQFQGQPILGLNELSVTVEPAVGPPRTGSEDAEFGGGGKVMVDGDADHVFSWRSEARSS